MNQKLYYLASPYSHSDPLVRESRFHMACDVAGYLMNRGLHVFSPIAHTHPIACRCDLPKGFDFWESYDRSMLMRCDSLLIVTAPGWRESKGVTAERIMAEGNMPIRYMGYPDFSGWCVRFMEGLEP